MKSIQLTLCALLFAIASLAQGPITGTFTVCTGGMTPLSDPPGTGTWSSSNPSVAVVDGSGHVTGITSGVTTITYTDGGMATQRVTVNPSPSPITGPGTVCPGQQISVSAFPPGASWSSSAPTTASVVSSGLSGLITGGAIPGTATITYTIAATNCSTSRVFTVPAAPSLVVSPGVSICAGSSTTLTASGGDTYTWTPATGLSATTGASVTATPTSTRTYTVTATNSSGCTSTATVAVNVNALPTVFAAFGGGSYCDGATGPHIFLSGTSAGVNYTLSPGGTVITSPTMDFGPQTIGGTYTVLATNATTGCSRTMAGSPSITINPLPPVHAVTGGGSFCSGGTGVDVALDGADAGINYALSPGGVVITGPTMDFGPQTIAGTYTVLATNSVTGCTNAMSGSVDVLVNALPAMHNVTGGGSYCSGGTGVDVALDGADAGINYALSPGGAVIIGPMTDFGPQTTGGTYTVLATNPVTGCTNEMSGSVDVVVNALPAVYYVTGGGNYCTGGTGVHISLTGADAGINYTLSPGGATITGPTTDFGPQTVAGTYTVMATNNITGCTNPMSGSAVITISTSPTATATSGTILCNGGTTTVSVTATGGVPPYTPAIPNIVPGVHAGTNSYIITDSKGCTGTATLTIAEPLALDLSGTEVNNVSCHGIHDGAIITHVTGGTGAYTYSWVGSTSHSSSRTTLVPGTYTVTVKDANNCTASASYTITQPDVIDITVTTTNVSCHGGSDGSLMSAVTGGTAPFSYNWTTTGDLTPGITGQTSGNYHLIVTDAHGCIHAETFPITAPSNIAIAHSFTNVTCNGGSNGTITTSSSGGTPGYNYLWSPGGYTTPSITGLTAGTYVLTVTDANGCTRTYSRLLTEPRALTLSGRINDVSCHGSTDGSITVAAHAGTPSYTYSWSNGYAGPDPSLLAPGTYTVTATDANSCTISNSYTVGEPAALSISAVITNVTVFGAHNGEINTTVTGGTTPYSYSWSPSGTGADPRHLYAGTYTVTVTDKNGCMITATYVVTQPAHKSATGNELGVDETNVLLVKVYPNPTHGIFNVEIPAQYTDAEIQVSDMTGRIIETRKVTNNNSQPIGMNLGRVPQGIYFVRVIAGEQTFVSKLLVD